MTTVGAIIVGAGRGERMGGQGGDKVFASLDGRPLLAYSVATFAASRVVQFIVVVLHERNLERGRALVQERRRDGEILGRGDLEVVVGAGEDRHRLAGRLEQRRLVGDREA